MMGDQRETKLAWALIDGELNEQDKTAFLKQLSEDPNLRLDFAEAQQLDTQLKKLAIEEPSMRFSANVMDLLPTTYKKLSLEPAIHQKTLWWGGLLLGSSILISIAAAFWGSGSNTPPSDFFSWKFFLDQYLSLPSKDLSLLALVSFCMVSIFFLDQILKRTIPIKRN